MQAQLTYRIKKNGWGEYVVEVRANGTLPRDACYYTDDKIDAKETMAQMKREEK